MRLDHVRSLQIYTMGMVDEVMVVGTGGRRVLIWDIRNMVSTISLQDLVEILLRFGLMIRVCHYISSLKNKKLTMAPMPP